MGAKKVALFLITLILLSSSSWVVAKASEVKANKTEKRMRRDTVPMMSTRSNFLEQPVAGHLVSVYHLDAWTSTEGPMTTQLYVRRNIQASAFRRDADAAAVRRRDAGDARVTAALHSAVMRVFAASICGRGILDM